MLATAAQVAATAPIASRLTTVALRAGGHADLEAALQWEALAQPVTLATEDLQEGIAAPGSGVPRGSPAAERGRARAVVLMAGPGTPAPGRGEAPARPARRLPSPCGRRAESAGGLICADPRCPHAGGSTPGATLLWTASGDRVWTMVHTLWTNLGTTVYDAVGDTPGRRTLDRR